MSSINPEFYAPYDYEAKVPTARHNLSTKVSFTCQTGAAVPFHHIRVYPKDDFKVNPLSLVQSILPLNRPLLDCFELRIETYFCPLSNYYGWIDNNSKESITDIMEKSEKWRLDLYGQGQTQGFDTYLFKPDFVPIEGEDFKLTADVVANQRYYYQDNFVGLGSLMSYMGIPACWCGNANGNIDISNLDSSFLGNSVNLEPFLCYLDIIRSYHVNTQYESIPFLNGYGRGTSDVNIFDTPFTHQQLDDLFVLLRSASAHRNFQGNILKNNYFQYGFNQPVRTALVNWLRLSQYRNGGFFPVQHRPDVWRNLLSVSQGNYQSKVIIANGVTTIDEIRQKSHIQMLADRVYLSGGRYRSLLKTVFGYTSYKSLHMPELLGVTRHLIDPSNITAMSASNVDGNVVELGQKGANIDRFNKGGNIRIKVDEDGYVMFLCSITPLVTYSQGFKPNALRFNFMDDFTPQMQRIGFNGVPRIYYSAYPDTQVVPVDDVHTVQRYNYSTIVGKTGKWMDEMTDVNHCYGEFTPGYGMYSDMVLSRKYTKIQSVAGIPVDDYVPVYYKQTFDLNPYVNPLDYNDIFAMQNIEDDPWSIHITLQINAKRPILKRFTPTLE